MADVVKTGWFGRKITVLMVNGKSITGELTQVSDNYIVVQNGAGVETQIMVRAIIAVRLAEEEKRGQSGIV